MLKFHINTFIVLQEYLQALICKFKVTSYKLQVTNHELQISSYKLQVTNYKLQRVTLTLLLFFKNIYKDNLFSNIFLFAEIK